MIRNAQLHTNTASVYPMLKKENNRIFNFIKMILFLCMITVIIRSKRHKQTNESVKVDLHGTTLLPAIFL